MSGRDCADDRPLAALGLMSGTSLDGIDAALVITDGVTIDRLGPALSLPYPEAFRSRLARLLGRASEAGDAAIIEELTDRHADAIDALIATGGIEAGGIDLIGFPGQTVLHQPEIGRTLQIGDAGRLANRLHLPVVTDFRSADVAAGGEGAPLVPLYHAALAERALTPPAAVVNIGGVANVTFIGSGEGDSLPLLAFDTGPGNALLDDWLRETTGAAFDAGGTVAAAGKADEARVARWLTHPYFASPPPKSLDRDTFQPLLDDLRPLSAADGAASLTLFTAAAIAACVCALPQPPRRWLITGGGRHNGTLMRMLRDRLPAPVAPVEALGWRGDYLEAEAFAFLAVRSIKGLPLSLPTTTGVAAPQPGGRLVLPDHWHPGSFRPRPGAAAAGVRQP